MKNRLLILVAALLVWVAAQACGGDGETTSIIQGLTCTSDLQCETPCADIVCMERPVKSAICDPEQELCACVCE